MPWLVYAIGAAFVGLITGGSVKLLDQEFKKQAKIRTKALQDLQNRKIYEKEQEIGDPLIQIIRLHIKGESFILDPLHSPSHGFEIIIRPRMRALVAPSFRIKIDCSLPVHQQLRVVIPGEAKFTDYPPTVEGCSQVVRLVERYMNSLV